MLSVERQTTESINGTETAPECREREREELENGELRPSYAINLNFPATTEIEVFNAIFESSGENLLKQL